MAEIVCQMSEKYEEYLIDESKYKGMQTVFLFRNQRKKSLLY